MSWYIDITGTRAAVKARAAQSNLPANILAVVNDVCDAAGTPPATNGIRVTGNGHAGGDYQDVVGKLEIIPVPILLDDPINETPANTTTP